MTSRTTGKVGTAVLAGTILLSGTLLAQERPPLAARTTAYSEARETVLQGRVSNYVENSAVAPIGAHVIVQTANGTVDVHLGPASFLQANHFTLSAGDSVKFIGMSIATDKGIVFLARIAQKGDRSITIRSPRGFLLAPASARTLPQAQGSPATQGVAR